ERSLRAPLRRDGVREQRQQRHARRRARRAVAPPLPRAPVQARHRRAAGRRRRRRLTAAGAPRYPAAHVANRFGAYEILYELRTGGMGSVLLGRRRGPGAFEQLVAIKTIRAEYAQT